MYHDLHIVWAQRAPSRTCYPFVFPYNNLLFKRYSKFFFSHNINNTLDLLMNKIKKQVSLKDAFVAPSLETIKKGMMLAVTLNPKTQYELISDIDDRIEKLNASYICFALSLSYADFKLYPELSPSGRWHYHGWIIIRDPARFYMKELDVLKEFGTYAIKHTTHATFADGDAFHGDAIWNLYCIKQKHIMEPLCWGAGITYVKRPQTVTLAQKAKFNEQHEANLIDNSFGRFENKNIGLKKN